MTIQEVELAEIIRDAYMTGGFIEAARAVLAAGYELRRDHVAEQDELRKQVRG